MGITAAIITAVSAAAAAYNQVQQASAVEKQAALAAKIAEENARLAEDQGADAIARGARAAGEVRASGRQMIGAQTAALAASGVDISTGSAVDVTAETARFSELDALTVMNNAAREAWGYRVEAANYRLAGAMGTLAAANEARALRAQAAGTLLTGAVNTYGIYRQAQPFSTVSPSQRAEVGRASSAGLFRPRGLLP